MRKLLCECIICVLVQPCKITRFTGYVPFSNFFKQSFIFACFSNDRRLPLLSVWIEIISLYMHMLAWGVGFQRFQEYKIYDSSKSEKRLSRRYHVVDNENFKFISVLQRWLTWTWIAKTHRSLYVYKNSCFEQGSA